MLLKRDQKNARGFFLVCRGLFCGMQRGPSFLCTGVWKNEGKVPNVNSGRMGELSSPSLPGRFCINTRGTLESAFSGVLWHSGREGACVGHPPPPMGWAKVTPGGLPNPKGSPRSPQGSPRAPQSSPPPPMGCVLHQASPRSPQGLPKGSPKAPQRLPKGLPQVTPGGALKAKGAKEVLTGTSLGDVTFGARPGGPKVCTRQKRC